jgi:urease accessory protein
MAYVYIMTPSGGILQGDRYRIDLAASKGAQAHITTQGATRIYKMERNFATQIVNIRVEDGCYLEYIPDQIIPFRDSRFYQTVNCQVHDNGALVYSEILTPGRVASDEAFQYDILYLSCQATNQTGKLKFIDSYILEPKKTDLRKIGILSEYPVVGSLYALANSEFSGKLVEELSRCQKKFQNLEAGVTTLPHDSGVVMRILGKTAEEVKALISEGVNVIRKTLVGAPFTGVRKY